MASEENAPVEKPVKGSTRDGPRYVASLQTEKDPCCYKDFFETEKQHEAKEQADKAAKENDRATIVYDRAAMDIIYRVAGPAKPVVEKPKATEPPVIKRGRPKRKQ